jgi:hypothetical protein
VLALMPILAEVADKEPTLPHIWCLAVIFSVSGLFLCRWRAASALLALLPAAIWAIALISELRDPFVGPAMIRELGRGYVAQADLAALIPLLIPPVIVAIKFCRRTRPCCARVSWPRTRFDQKVSAYCSSALLRAISKDSRPEGAPAEDAVVVMVSG